MKIRPKWHQFGLHWPRGAQSDEKHEKKTGPGSHRGSFWGPVSLAFSPRAVQRRAEGRQEAEKRLKKEHPKSYRFVKVENVAENLPKSCRNVSHFYVFSENAQMSETICFPIENVVPGHHESID